MGERARDSAGASPRPSPRRPLAARLVVALAAMVVTLAVALRLVVLADARGWLPPLPPPFDRPPHFVALEGGELFAIDRSAAKFLGQPGGADYSLARAKAAGAFRILSLGESTTFGAGYAPTASYSRFLEERLRRQSGRDVEVVNCGRNGYDSHDLPTLAAELGGFAPDLIVAYVGHNEIKRPNLLGLLDPDAARIARSRLLLRLLGVPRDRDFAPPSLQIGPYLTPEQRARGRELFADGLAALVDAAQRLGVPLLLCVPASNVIDHAPRGSVVRAGEGAEARLARATELANAPDLRALDKPMPDGDAGELIVRMIRDALAAVDAALAADPGVALLHWRRGRLLLLLREREAAAAAFDRSLQLDDLPERASPDLIDLVRAAGREPGVTLVDVAARFAHESGWGAPGFDLFYDYCHPKLRGHWLIADELVRALASGAVAPALGPLDASREPGGAAASDRERFEACCRELGVSESATAAQLVVQARGFANDVGTRPEIPSESDRRVIDELLAAALQIDPSLAPDHWRGRPGDLYVHVLRGLVAAARGDGVAARGWLSSAEFADPAGCADLATRLAGLPGWVAALGSVGITLRDGAFAWEGRE